MKYKRARWGTVLKADALRKLERGSRKRGALALKPNDYAKGSHIFFPKDKKLLEKMGLKKGERVHFFAAYSGGWARALAEHGLKVWASDVSKIIVEKLKSNPGRIEQITRMPAGYGSITPNYYDWSISFEPYPAFNPARFEEDALRQGLINKKGVKIIYLNADFKIVLDARPMDEKIIRRMKYFAGIYGAKVEEKRMIVGGAEREFFGTNTNETQANLSMLTMETTPEARRKAELDLYVERRKYSRTGTQGELVKKLAKEFYMSEREIRESLKRIRETEKIGLNL